MVKTTNSFISLIFHDLYKLPTFHVVAINKKLPSDSDPIVIRDPTTIFYNQFPFPGNLCVIVPLLLLFKIDNSS